MATQAERRARTRRRIIDAARTRFTEAGWDGTSITEILDDAGVSRGALYHHFSSKEDVFAAVYAEVSADAIARAARSTVEGASRLETFVSACAAWLQIVQEPNVARVLLIDGPSALGWKRCREVEAETSLHVTEAGLAAAARAGEIAPPSIHSAALLVNALLAEAALATASHNESDDESSNDSNDEPDDLFQTIEMMIAGLAS